MQRPFATVILAAGQGTRMKSHLPKVLHEIAGLPMVCWAVRSALESGSERVVVIVGHGRERVEEVLKASFDNRVTTAVQEEQRGTGHAARCGLPALENFQGDVVITYGDVPLLEGAALDALSQARNIDNNDVALLTCQTTAPHGYGRILRTPEGAVTGIREHKDCSPEELSIQEINPGVYAADIDFLRNALAGLSDNNAQGELYLTDIVEVASNKKGVHAVDWPLESLMGVNDRAQLAEASAVMRRRIAVRHAQQGVTIRDLEHVTIDADVQIAQDAIIENHVTLRGQVSIGARTRIDVGCVLENVTVGEDTYLKPYTIATDSQVGTAAQVGPFSHLRPGSNLGPETRVGNFVETKQTNMARGAKANHLAYLGNGEIGEKVNVGAGTIFCNYDGYQKHTTVLEDGAFIGSDSQLVAPVTVGEGAYVATGTTVTRNVPANALAIGRIKQDNKDGYASRLRARMAAAKKRALSKTSST